MDKEDVVYYMYTMEYYSVTKKNEIRQFAATWMDLESVILSEVNQTEKEKYHMVPLICGSEKEMIQIKLLTKQKETHRLRKFMVAAGKGELGTLGRSCTHGYI